MRLRTLIVWLVLLGFIAWAAYTILAAGSSYLEVSALVEKSVTDAVARRKAQLAAGQSFEAQRDFVPNVRAGILRGGAETISGFDPEGVRVTEAQEGVRVSVSWAFPAVVYQGRVLLTIPMSLARAFTSS